MLKARIDILRERVRQLEEQAAEQPSNIFIYAGASLVGVFAGFILTLTMIQSIAQK